MPAKQAGRGEAGSAALAEDGEAARGRPQARPAVHPAHVHPLKEQHEESQRCPCPAPCARGQQRAGGARPLMFLLLPVYKLFL